MYIVYTRFMIVARTATQARKEFFELLAAAKYDKQVTEISLNGECVAVIAPQKKKAFDWEKYEKEMKKASKIIKKADWSDLKKIRKNFDLRIKGWSK